MIKENKTLPARIVKYYPQTQTADIKICAERVYSNIDGKNQRATRELLIGVPVHIPSGGGWALTFPIAVGDTCLVVFSQIGYDHWLYKDKDEGGTLIGRPVPHLMRSWSESDGFALVGFNTLPRAITNYSPTNSEWKNKNSTQRITLKQDGSIEMNSNVNIKLTAPTVNIVGNLTVNGTGTFTNDCTIAGKSFNSHTHKGDSGGTTSAPN